MPTDAKRSIYAPRLNTCTSDLTFSERAETGRGQQSKTDQQMSFRKR